MVHALLDKITGFFFEQTRGIFDAAGGGIDVFYLGDDYGMQNGLLMSKNMWREFYKPRLYGLAHDYGIKVMQHSCGNIYELIP